MPKDHKFKITNPHAMVILWNYNDRIDSDGANDPHKIERIILTTASLRSISTNKNKGQPAGQFELRLAPTFNWVSRITPGSWCSILMSQDDSFANISAHDVGFASPETFKMLGRIDSVRMVVNVDQQTGARMTEFVVT